MNIVSYSRLCRDVFTVEVAKKGSPQAEEFVKEYLEKMERSEYFFLVLLYITKSVSLNFNDGNFQKSK